MKQLNSLIIAGISVLFSVSVASAQNLQDYAALVPELKPVISPEALTQVPLYRDLIHSIEVNSGVKCGMPVYLPPVVVVLGVTERKKTSRFETACEGKESSGLRVKFKVKKIQDEVYIRFLRIDQ